MNKKITLSLALLSFIFSVNAQTGADIDTAIKYGRYDVAKKDLYKLIKSQPNQGRNFYRLGTIHLIENNQDSANYYFKQGLRAVKEPDINNIGIGKISLLNGKDKEAKSKFNAGTNNLPLNDYETFLVVADAYTKAPKPDFDAALEYVNYALLVDLKIPKPHIARGDIYFAEKRFVDARRVYFETSKMFPESLLPKMKLADVFRAGNEFGEAIKVYDSIVAKNPDYIDVYKQLGLTYADYARFEDDKSLLDKGVENYFKYHGLIGESLDTDNELAAYLIKNKHYKALGDLVRTKWYTRGDNFYMYRYRAIADFQNGKFADAKESINKYFDVQDKKENI